LRGQPPRKMAAHVQVMRATTATCFARILLTTRGRAFKAPIWARGPQRKRRASTIDALISSFGVSCTNFIDEPFRRRQGSPLRKARLTMHECGDMLFSTDRWAGNTRMNNVTGIPEYGVNRRRGSSHRGHCNGLAARLPKIDRARPVVLLERAVDYRSCTRAHLDDVQ